MLKDTNKELEATKTQAKDEINRLYEEYRDQLSYYKEAIENSFGEPVCEVHLISLSLGESIRVF